MSVVQNVLIGRTKQKIGNAVFTTWKGINVLKSKPLTVENPQTDNQVMRRSALSQAVAFYRTIAFLVTVGWKELAIHKSEYNAFVSLALREAFDYSSPPTASFTPAQFTISKGTIAQADITSATASAGTKVVAVNWDAAGGLPGQSSTDIPLIAVFNDDAKYLEGFIGNNERSDGSQTVTLSGDLTIADDLFVYLGFYNPTTGKASDSYITTVVTGA